MPAEEMLFVVLWCIGAPLTVLVIPGLLAMSIGLMLSRTGS